MNYILSLTPDKLPPLDAETQKLISENEHIIKNVLHDVANFSGFGEVTKSTLSFDQVVEQYNKGISFEEIQAWVWYQRKKGVPMKGWNKYYIKENENSSLKNLVLSGALFYFNGGLIPFPLYTYGNMYDRLIQLEKDKETIISTYSNDVYLNHKKVLEQSKPELLSITNPDPKERPIITAISDFAQQKNLFQITLVRDEFMELEKAEELKKVNGQTVRKTSNESIKMVLDGETSYTLQTVFIKWLYTLNVDSDFEKSSPIDVADYYIVNKPLRDDKLSKEEKTELKANARLEGERLFSKFLHEVLTFEDQQKLDYAWNRVYNGQSDINYAKVPIGFECSARFKSGLLQITEIQREGVAFMEAMGSGINAFDVGVGKTMTAIINLAHNLYSGKCKRPLIVVPKPTYKKWKNEIIGFTDKKTGEFVPGVLSHTGVTINDWYNLGTDTIGKLNLNKEVAENSITILTYEEFKRLGFGDSVSDDLFVELVNVLSQSKERTARDAEIEYQKFREMIGVGLKNSIADVDVLGFDYAVIDEAHRCKNVFSQVKSDEEGNKRYNIQSAVSEIGQKAFLILSYIQRKFGRNTMLLTATPFSNSPLEIYSMLSLVAYDSLRANGIENVDTFFDLFVLPTVEWTANYKEEIVEKEVIKSFTNRRILQKLIYNHILYKTGEEAGVIRPKKINLPLIYDYNDTKKRLPVNEQVLTYINMTPLQRENQNAIVNLAKKSTSGKLDMGSLFKALAYSLDNALSPYILQGTPEDYKQFIENSPKIQYVMKCIESVKKWHEDKDQEVSGQVIYMNRGKAFFPLIKEYLEREVGFKKDVTYDRMRLDEVEIISSEVSDTKKEVIKEAFLDGVVKIIIGTATIREGIDLQKRGTVIYNCYPEWNPTDIRQLEGRIWRQGNMFEYVRIVMPLIQDSMDVFVFQKLEEKTARINDIWFKGDRGNVLDLESLDPEEIKLALITDVDRLVRMFFDQEKEQLNRDYKKIKLGIELLKNVQDDIQKYNSYRTDCIKVISDLSVRIKNEPFMQESFKRNSYEETNYEKCSTFLESFNAFKTSTDQKDQDLIALGRKAESIHQQLRWYFSYKYVFSYLKEYVSRIRKTERTILKPKGYTLQSDLKPVLEQYETDKKLLEEKATEYKDDLESPRWSALRIEIEKRKSALEVEGKSAEDRAKDFGKLNHLLEFKSSVAQPKKSIFSILELEAIALELELELLNF